MQNKLRGYLTDNSVTSDPNDKILVLDPAGNVGLPKFMWKCVRKIPDFAKKHLSM